MNLFVYGTLRKDAGLSGKMDSFEYLGGFKSTPEYSMYDMGYPAINEGGVTSIVGEIYKIENINDILPIHNMEVGCGYALLPIKIEGFTDVVFAYFMKPEWDLPIIPGGDWVKYREEKRIHGHNRERSLD